MSHLITEPDAAWTAFQKRAKDWAPAAETLRYRNIFSRGFLITQGYTGDAAPSNWFSTTVGQWQVRFDPRQPVVFKNDGDGNHLAILGHVFSSEDGLIDGDSVGNKLVTQLPRNDSSWDAFDSLVSMLSGRFVLVAVSRGETRVHVDAMATKSCFWNVSDDLAVLASHSGMLAEVVGNHSTEGVDWVMNHPDYVNPGGKTLPGRIHAHDCADIIFANCALLITEGSARHERFFPSGNLEQSNLESAVSHFIDELKFQIMAWGSVSDTHIVALTAGRDSRALLSCGLETYKEIGAAALSYHFFSRDSQSTLEDVIGANRLALLSGMPHIIQDVRQLAAKTPMAELYQKTFPSWARFPTLAGTFYETLPESATLTLGIGGGIGTAFYKERSEPLSPELLAKKFAYSGFHKDPKLVSVMAEYMEFTELSGDSIYNYDFYDLFHWEHRLSKWAAVGYSEYDLSVIPAVPFNSRRLLNAMLSLPIEDRMNKQIYEIVGDISGITL